jgi:hypothetical protein
LHSARRADENRVRWDEGCSRSPCSRSSAGPPRRARSRRPSCSCGSPRSRPSRAKFTLRRPRRVGFYAGRLTFPGTRWIDASEDPNVVPLLARSRDLVYAQSIEIPHCG